MDWCLFTKYLRCKINHRGELIGAGLDFTALYIPLLDEDFLWRLVVVEETRECARQVAILAGTDLPQRQDVVVMDTMEAGGRPLISDLGLFDLGRFSTWKILICLKNIWLHLNNVSWLYIKICNYMISLAWKGLMAWKIWTVFSVSLILSLN